MIMLEGTFSSIEFNDTDSIRQALSSMSQGLFTALNTTLIGLVSSIILKVQLTVYGKVKGL